MKEKLPNIYNYNNFRKYLADYQKARYSYNKSFTKSNICKLLGQPNTRSYFNNIINGKIVSSVFAERFINLLCLNNDEAQFFRVLVKFNQADNPNEKELYFEQLISLNKTPSKTLNLEIFEYYKNWYNSAIRAILNIYTFSGNYNELAKKVFPNITVKQAKESIQLLTKLKLIAKKDDGTYKLTENSISAPEYIRNDLIAHYQMKSLDLAKASIALNHSLPQTMATNTISISEEGYKRLEKKIHRFRSEVRSLVHKDEKEPDRVYQMAIQLFPNSK